MATALKLTKAKRSWRSRFLSLLAGLFGLALLIGLPYALIQLVGNPLDLLPGTVDEFRDGIDRRYISSDWIIGFLAIVMWLLWAQFVWALLWEILVTGPAAARGRLTRTAPLVPSFTRSLASAVVSGLLASSVVVGGTSLATVAGNLAVGSEALATAPAAPALTDSAAAVSPNVGVNRVHNVGQRETLWSIAGQNEQMVVRLLELNEHQLRSPLDLRPGMDLVVPPSLNLGTVPGADDGDRSASADLDEAEAQPLAGATADSVGSSNGVGDARHVVVEGDNLWEIAEGRLRFNNGAEPSNLEVAEQVNELVEGNPSVIEDPDLIYPGEVLELPGGLASRPDGATPVPNGDGPLPADPSPVSPESAVSSEPAQASPDETLLPSEETPASTSTEVDIHERDGATEPEQVVDEPAADDPSTDDGDQPAEDGLVSITGPLVGGGLIAATALVALIVGWKRRLRGRAGATSTRDRIDDDDRQLLAELTEHSDRAFVNWAAAELRTLRESLAPDSGVAPRAVWLGGHATPGPATGGDAVGLSTGLTVRWDRPMPEPVPGWERVDESRWHRPFDDLAPSPDEPGPAAIPGLVSLGRVVGGPDDGRQLLIDLEATGSIALGGRAELIESAAESIVLEAGAGGPISNLRVTTVGFHIPAADALERVRSLDEAAALSQAEAIVEQFEARSGSPGTFHPGTAADGSNDVELFVVRTVQAAADQWMSLAGSRRGVALLLIGDMRSTRLGARLAIDDDGTGTLTPFDQRIEVCGLAVEASQQLANLFDRLLASPEADTGPVPSPSEVMAWWSELDQFGPTGFDAEDGRDRTGPDPIAPMAPSSGAPDQHGPDADTGDPTAASPDLLEIQLLGHCRCDERPGLVARPMALVAFLALQPGMSASSDAVVRALWGRASVAEGELARVVAAARSHIGVERLPKRQSDAEAIQLTGVSTDLDRLRHLLVRASTSDQGAAAADLVQAMELIIGPPLDGVLSDWAEASGLTDHLCELIEATTIRAIEAVVAVGEVDRVPALAMRGLGALPTNEAIYRSYMKVAAEVSGTDLVDATYDHLRRSIEAQSPTEDRHPSEQTTRLRNRLVQGLAEESSAQPVAAAPAGEPMPPMPPEPPRPPA